MLSEDIAWASSGPGKFCMQYLPGIASCCRWNKKKFWEAHKQVKGKREPITKSEIWTWAYPMHRHAILYRPMTTTVIASSQGLKVQSEQRIFFKCTRTIGTSKSPARAENQLLSIVKINISVDTTACIRL